MHKFYTNINRQGEKIIEKEQIPGKNLEISIIFKMLQIKYIYRIYKKNKTRRKIENNKNLSLTPSLLNTFLI